MKNLLLITCLILPLFLSGCKKDNEDDPTPLQVEVSGLTDLTSIYMQIDDQSNKRVLTLDNSFGNKTYNTEAVNQGDVLTVKYKANRTSDNANNGVGTIKFLYKGELLGSAGGQIGYPDWKTLTIVVQ